MLCLLEEALPLANFCAGAHGISSVRKTTSQSSTVILENKCDYAMMQQGMGRKFHYKT